MTAGCGSDDAGDVDVGASPPEGVTTVPGEPSSSPPELTAHCGRVEFAELPAEIDGFPAVDEVDIEEFELPPTVPADDPQADDTQLEYDSFFPEHEWFVAEHTDDEVVLFGHKIDPADDIGAGETPAYAAAHFERDETGGWEPTGWEDCRIEVTAPGWGNAHFWLDPDVEPDPESTMLSVQANEMACANGEAPDGRDVTSVVVAEDDESVAVVILVEPLQGNATCPSNPAFPFTIELESNLGDRTILDASVDPPLERPWPPTQTSIDSTGLSE